MRTVSGTRTWFSGRVAGVLGIGAVLADTGALPAGLYNVKINLALAEAVIAGVGLFIEHRDAANAATVKDLGGTTPGGGGMELELENYRLALNERIRIVGGSAATTAAGLSVGAIGYQRVAAE